MKRKRYYPHLFEYFIAFFFLYYLFAYIVEVRSNRNLNSRMLYKA